MGRKSYRSAVVEMYVRKWAQGGSGKSGKEEGRGGYEWKRVDGEDRNVTVVAGVRVWR